MPPHREHCKYIPKQALVKYAKTPPVKEGFRRNDVLQHLAVASLVYQSAAAARKTSIPGLLPIDDDFWSPLTIRKDIATSHADKVPSRLEIV